MASVRSSPAHEKSPADPVPADQDVACPVHLPLIERNPHERDAERGRGQRIVLRASALRRREQRGRAESGLGSPSRVNNQPQGYLAYPRTRHV
jgi:hypothetical protein